MNCCKDTYEAARNGHLECLKYCFENGCLSLHSELRATTLRWDPETTYVAATNGHLECLKYCVENGCPWDDHTTRGIVAKGYLECLKYCIENGCPWDPDTTYVASKNGQLDCLKYAHENGCPWYQITTYTAAKNGHLDCLKYAHEKGCPWDPETTYIAAANDYFDCLSYCLDNDQSELDITDILQSLSSSSLINNLPLRQVIFHPKLIDEVHQVQKIQKAVRDYELYIVSVRRALETKTSLPMDIIKYKIMKMI